MIQRQLEKGLVAALALTLGGCGGGGGGGSTPPGPPPFLTLSTFQEAAVVIGQPDFTSADAHQGGSPAANTIGESYGHALVVAGRLYVPDYASNRVLGFNTVPTVNNAAADFVLGQPNFTTTDPGSDPDQLHGPEALATYNGKLLVADYDNNRVLIWNTIPTTTAAPADLVVGQADFGSGAAGCSSTTLESPESLTVAGGKLIVADSGNHRVLVWNSIPTTSGAPADLVLGQAAFNTCAPNDRDQDGAPDAESSAQTFFYPSDVWSDGTRLAVVDQVNSRVLIWTTFPTSNFEPADLVLGQQDFTSSAANDNDGDGTPDPTPSARTFDEPYFLDSNGTQLFVTDTANNRVLVWNSFPTVNFAPADVVLGQQDFTSSAANDNDGDGTPDPTPSARTFDEPYFLDSNGTQLFVTDTANNRVLVWNSFPTVNFAPADVVLGQQDFTSSAANDNDGDGTPDPTPSARTLDFPAGIHVTDTQLFVADISNNRWLIFNGQ